MQGTGTPLFELRDPHDAAVLFGEAPFEFRVVTVSQQRFSVPLPVRVPVRVTLR
jgi:hypothetical protein